MTSKGKAHANTGKETRNHLSVFRPMNTESPTEAQTSADKPAYCSNSLRLSGGEFSMFNFPSQLLLGRLERICPIAAGDRHMAFSIKTGGRFDL